MESKGNFLVVDDDATMRDVLRECLVSEGHSVTTADNAIQAIAELEKREFDVVLADLTLPRVSGLELLDHIKKTAPAIEVIVVTGQGSIATAVDAIKRGAYHYVTKPCTADEILHLVSQALERRRLVDPQRPPRSRTLPRPRRPPTRRPKRPHPTHPRPRPDRRRQRSHRPHPGESGTGKEIIANAIHTQSRRARAPSSK